MLEVASRKGSKVRNNSKDKVNVDVKNVVTVFRDDDSDDECVHYDDHTFATLQAAKLYSDNQISTFMTSLSKKLDSYQGVLSADEMKGVELLFTICANYIDMSVSEASNDVVLGIVDSIKDIADELSKIGANIPNRLLFYISPFTRLFLREDSNTTETHEEALKNVEGINVRNKELRAIKESGAKWRAWGKEWVNKSRDRSRSTSKQGEKEEMLLCRICERMIPSTDMITHSEHCMENMLAFKSDQQLKEFEGSCVAIVKILSENLRKTRRRTNEPTYEECAHGLEMVDCIVYCDITYGTFSKITFKGEKAGFSAIPKICQISFVHFLIIYLELANLFLANVNDMKQYNENHWSSREHHLLVQTVIRTCEEHLQNPIVEIEELCQQGVDVGE